MSQMEGDQCLEVPRGAYTTSYNSTTCSVCSNGLTTLNPGASSAASCGKEATFHFLHIRVCSDTADIISKLSE